MKAIVFRIAYVVIGGLIIFIISLGLINLAKTTFEKQSLDLLSRFKAYKPYAFNISDLLVDPNDPTVFDSTNQSNYYTLGSDTVFCKNLRNCTEMNIQGGSRCVISYKVKPGTTFSPDDVYKAVQNCPDIDIKEELYGGTGREVCKFDHSSIVNYNKISEDNISVIDYEPYLHNCYLPDNLGSYNVLGDVDSINYLYSGRGTPTGYKFENGGMVRIVVTNVSIKNDPYATCSYSLYICGQNAIAAKENETPVYVFKNIQNLNEKELYYNETIMSIALGKYRVDLVKLLDFYYLGLFPPGGFSTYIIYNIYGYYPRTYEFSFSGTYPNENALIDAIDTGMWEWNKINYDNKNKLEYFLNYYSDLSNIHFSYAPIDTVNNVSVDAKLDFNSGCWNSNYESYTPNQENYNRLGYIWPQNILHIFKLNSVFNNPLYDLNNKKIRMALGIRKMFITDIDETGGFSSLIWFRNWVGDASLPGRAILVMDPVTFCSE